jgi:transcriptional regulator with XRE-family HTH domain
MKNAPKELKIDETVAEFVDEHMGLPVILIDSVRKSESNGVAGVIVPDVPGLEAAMAVARISDELKLSGQDIRFLRRAIGVKAVDLAGFLDVTPETVSRWENGKELISTNADRVLRMRVYNTLKHKVPGVKCDLNSIVEMKFQVARLAGAAMMFRHVLAVKDGVAQKIWYYEGLRAAPEVTKRLKA